MINCRQPEVVCSYEKYLLHLKKTKNKELQKLTEYEHGTSYEKNANEEQLTRYKKIRRPRCQNIGSSIHMFPR